MVNYCYVFLCSISLYVVLGIELVEYRNNVMPMSIGSHGISSTWTSNVEGEAMDSRPRCVCNYQSKRENEEVEDRIFVMLGTIGKFNFRYWYSMSFIFLSLSYCASCVFMC